MGNYENLKQSITEVIRTNGNQKITGAVLQSTLLTIISTVGANATFAGIATLATNPGTPDGPVFYLASEAGTYTNFGSIELQAGLSVLMWNGSWNSQQIFSIDNEPTAGSGNLVKSGGVQKELALGAVYDVSAKNPTGGSNNDGKWESLSALLSDANLNTLIPTAVRRGGMSIKFVQSSDNKYVQYRLMSGSFNTTVANWQGVDDYPTVGSKNIPTSGGVKAELVSNSIINTSKDANNVLLTNCFFEAGSMYRLTVWSESAITCTQFYVSSPIGSKKYADIASYDGTPIIIEGVVQSDVTNGEVTVWISDNQSVGTKIYTKVELIYADNTLSKPLINKKGLTIASGENRVSVDRVPALQQDQDAIVSIEGTDKIKRINFIENTTSWRVLSKIEGDSITTNTFKMPAGCTYVQIDTIDNLSSAITFDITIFAGSLFEKLNSTDKLVDNLTDEIKRNSIIIESYKEGSNIFTNKYTFVKDSTYRIAIWSEQDITCTQFSLITSLGDKVNTGIVNYDGTPVVLVAKAESNIYNGQIAAWISDNQGIGTKLYCSVEIISFKKDISAIRGDVILDADKTITTGDYRATASVKALSANVESMVFIYGTDKIVKLNFVENTTTWRSLGVITGESITRKAFVMPAGCTYIQIDTASNVTEDLDFHIVICTGTSMLQQINQSIDKLESDAETPNIVKRNQDKISALYSMCRYNGLGHTSMQPANTRPFKDAEFVLVADHHSDSKALSNAVELLNGVPCIDALIHCGDFGGGIYSPSIGPDMYAILASAEKTYLAVIGNHDVGTSIVIEQCCDHATAYHDYIKPLVDNGMLVTGEYEDGKCYYYHDFTERKIRMIFLYEYDDPMEIDETIWEAIPYDDSLPLIGANGTSYQTGAKVRLANYTTYAFQAKQDVTLATPDNWSNTTRPAYKIPRGVRVIRQEQAQWFLDTLASTPEGYGVIVVTHMPFSKNGSKVDCDFSISLNNNGDIATITDDFIADAVNAYINKSNFSKTVVIGSYLTMEGFSYAVSCDFSQAEGQFLCYLGGHNHCDLVLKHQTYNQYGIYPTAARTWGYANTDYMEDIAHSNEDGVAYDCLTVVSPAADRIMLAKVGATKTIDGRTREYQLLDQNSNS